ncbi:hypothetical protein D3C86_1182570 [compost metagenome]
MVVHNHHHVWELRALHNLVRCEFRFAVQVVSVACNLRPRSLKEMTPASFQPVIPLLLASYFWRSWRRRVIGKGRNKAGVCIKDLRAQKRSQNHSNGGARISDRSTEGRHSLVYFCELYPPLFDTLRKMCKRLRRSQHIHRRELVQITGRIKASREVED